MTFAPKPKPNPSPNPNPNPNPDPNQVLLALALSAYAFFLIFVLDKLADADFTGPDADAFIYTFMGGLGILIGFAWEQVPPTPNPTLTLPTHH